MRLFPDNESTFQVAPRRATVSAATRSRNTSQRTCEMEIITPNLDIRESSPATSSPSLDDLCRMPRKQLKFLFCDLEPPSMEEMNGEYHAVLLDQGAAAAQILVRFLANLRGIWVGKAFSPISEHEGRGYNSFRTRRGVQRRMRMRTAIRPSALHDGNSYTLDYRGLNWGLIGTMVDEVRRVSPGLYLGFGGVPIRSNMYFALSGPVSEFRHEV